MRIRPCGDADAPALWRVLEPTIRGGETYALPRELTYPLGGASIVQEALLQGRSSIRWYLTPSLREQEFLANVPPGALDGAVGVSPGVLPGRAEGFQKRYEARWNGDTPRLEAYYYYDMAAIVTLALAAAADGSESNPTYASLCDEIPRVANGPGQSVGWDELSSAVSLADQGVAVNYEGLSGDASLGAFGNSTGSRMELWEIANHQIHTVEIIIP